MSIDAFIYLIQLKARIVETFKTLGNICVLFLVPSLHLTSSEVLCFNPLQETHTFSYILHLNLYVYSKKTKKARTGVKFDEYTSVIIFLSDVCATTTQYPETDHTGLLTPALPSSVKSFP